MSTGRPGLEFWLLHVIVVRRQTGMKLNLSEPVSPSRMGIIQIVPAPWVVLEIEWDFYQQSTYSMFCCFQYLGVSAF